MHIIAGVRTLLLHGDTLCLDDGAYQAFRRQVRDPQWQRQFLAQPLAQRRAFAHEVRAASTMHTQSSPHALLDVDAGAVSAAMRDAGVRRLIHGHTHRPALHRFTLDGAPAERIVLGDWYEQGSRLRIDEQGIDLRAFAADRGETAPTRMSY